jgi:hypothetical protein
MAIHVVYDVVDCLYREIGAPPVDRQDGAFPMVDPNNFKVDGSYLYESHGVVGNSLVNSVTMGEELDRNGNLVRVDALFTAAVAAIRQASTKVQVMGLWFNTYRNVTFKAPTGTMVVEVPSNLLSFQNHSGMDIGVRMIPPVTSNPMWVAVVKKKFVDKATGNDQLGEVSLKSVVYEYVLEELPFEARELIRAEAAKVFVRQQLSDTERVRELEKEAADWARKLSQLDTMNKNRSVLNTWGVSRLLSKMKPWRN